MVKVTLPFQTKYKGRYIAANRDFEVDDNDKKELLKIGGKIVGEKSEPTTKKAENTDPGRTK